jgi:hypothetical protein
MFAHHGRCSRRSFLFGAAAFSCTARASQSYLEAKALYLVLAPSNLGLRPEPGGKEPGTWQAPAAIYDPTRDAHDRYAAPIVAALKGAFT